MRGRGWAGVGRRRALAALLLLGAALCARLRLHSHLSAQFPDVTPHALAHFLADFSNYPKLYPDIESWSVEEESGNYTWWRYSVVYSCGARCAGRAQVWHRVEGEAGAEGGAPRHGAAAQHRLRVDDARCSSLPLLPFLRICTEQWVESVVGGGGGGGAVLVERAEGACGAAQALRGLCRLEEQRRRHLDALRLLLSSSS